MVSPETIPPVTGPSNRAKGAVSASGPLLGGWPTGGRLEGPITDPGNWAKGSVGGRGL